MLRERVSDDVFVFSSEIYAQVTAGAIVSPEGAVLIDTMPFPSESLEIKDYLENKIGSRIIYIINTHYHADHTNGNCLYPGALIIGHQRCRELLDTAGRQGLARAKEQGQELARIEIALPEALVTGGALQLHVGRKTLQIFPTPGHSADSVSVLLKEDRILFAGDMMMPLPYIVDGDVGDLTNSLQSIPGMGLENVVQGHGEVVLRGEIDDAVKSNIRYLDTISKKVEQALGKKKARESLREITLESCGKSRIPLNGLVTQLHAANLFSLYDRLAAQSS